MRRGLYDLIVSLRYYARFLRTNDIEDAVRAVQHSQDREEHNCHDYSQEEREKAVEICRSHNHGQLALLEWRKKKTKVAANMAFVILSREGQKIPHDLLEAVTKNVEQWIENYEKTQQTNKSENNGGSFDEKAWQFAKLKSIIKRNTNSTDFKTKVEIFKEYAAKWEISAIGLNEPWEVLRERYKTRRKVERGKLKKRLNEPNIRTREKSEILEELDAI